MSISVWRRLIGCGDYFQDVFGQEKETNWDQYHNTKEECTKRQKDWVIEKKFETITLKLFEGGWHGNKCLIMFNYIQK